MFKEESGEREVEERSRDLGEFGVLFIELGDVGTVGTRGERRDGTNVSPFVLLMRAGIDLRAPFLGDMVTESRGFRPWSIDNSNKGIGCDHGNRL